MRTIPPHWQWFDEARFGMFLHWGPYSALGHGEQAINREQLDQRAYAARAIRWNPEHYDPAVWAATARAAGMRYAVLTARHGDGYCLWDSQYTDYSSARQAPKRDFVAEYLAAFRNAGLRVGLYYALYDVRIPAWFDGPAVDPAGFAAMRQYIYDQVDELLTRYGKIDVLWFDGLWPRSEVDIDSRQLIGRVRARQPDILVNDRLQWPQFSYLWQLPPEHRMRPEQEIGDFGTAELGIYSDPDHLWESCQTSTWRLWGYAPGERWHGPERILDMLVQCASRQGNLLLNVGPQPDGQLPTQYVERTRAVGDWLAVHGEAIYGSHGGSVTESVTYGWQTVKGNDLYLICRFWDGQPTLRVADLVTPVRRASLLTTGQELAFEQRGLELFIHGLPAGRPTELFPVIKLECSGPPQGGEWAQGPWSGDTARWSRWARTRGTSVWADGQPR